MQDGGASHSRPLTPESPLASSFYHATSTIDDLTLALANFSRVPSPELPTLLTCCCGREDCENTKAWLEFKSRLESRLILSAEVGQALLQRHEAYVRRHEGRHRRLPSARDKQDYNPSDEALSQELMGIDVSELTREKAILEQRLNQALVNNEVTEVSNKTILLELQEARATISRLTVHHARSVGWETRLAVATKEKEDMQQERDSESLKAKLTETRLTAMKERTGKLQAEVRRLQETLEERRIHRLESSEFILQHARTKLESLYRSELGQTAMVEQTELTNVLESLVGDNETLKRDNAELQNLLTDSREEIHALQEEVEEQRVNSPFKPGVGTPYSKQYVYTGSVPSSMPKDHALYNFDRRSSSMEPKLRRPLEPLTPETNRRPLSPADSLAPSETRWTTFGQPQPRYPSSQISFEIEEAVDQEDDPSSPEKRKTHKTLILLTRSRGVQTDSWAGLLSPSPFQSYISSPSPHDLRSESPSFSEPVSSNFAMLLERVVALLNRMTQADAFTLTNRLKRQHLKGADVGHLSRSTVSNILSEAAGLRTQFRSLLEDEKAITSCTRKDLRALFKIFKDVFTEMGQMRVALNDIVLDPSIAPKVSELMLEPNKVEKEQSEKGRESGAGSVTGGWMAPISKLFSPAGRGENSEERATMSRSVSGQLATRPRPRFVPKLGPALSASATTVNVEFSGTGVSRSTTSTTAAQTSHDSSNIAETNVTQNISPGIMSIFAGAPRSTTPDPWVVLPKGPRRVQSFIKPVDTFSPATLRRSKSGRGGVDGFSGDDDAVTGIERLYHVDEQSDFLPPLRERKLRRRGLSDSSIHSTFTSQTGESRTSALNVPMGDRNSPRETWPDRSSVLKALNRTVQNFRMTASGTVSGKISPSVGTSPPKQPSLAGPARVSSPSLSNLLPDLSSWAAAGGILDPVAGADPFVVGSVREESFMQRTRRPGESHSHEYF